MAQGDLNVANQSGAAFRADLNNQLLALGTLQSGASEPSTTYAYMLWADTTAGQLKQRNAANSGWVILGALATANFGLVGPASPSFTGTASFAGDVLLTGTGVLDLPVGTTAQRPGSPTSGMVRFNSSQTQFEGYNGTAWSQLNTGLSGVNRIINGDARVGQRGSVTFTSTNNLYGWADRWLYSVSATTVSALAFRASGSLGAGGPASGCAVQVGNVLTTGTTTVAISQRIESLNCFDLNSATITVSGKVLQTTGSAQTLTVSLGKANALDNFATQTVISSTAQSIPNNVWTPFAWTLTLGATDASNGLQLSLSFNSMAAQSTTQFYFSDVQLEKGSAATPFETRSYGQELELCQRYYQTGNFKFWSYNTASNAVGGTVSFNTSMRAVPTVATPGATGSNAGTIAIEATYLNGFILYAPAVATGAVSFQGPFTASIEL